jgi:hypothetical protein
MQFNSRMYIFVCGIGEEKGFSRSREKRIEDYCRLLLIKSLEVIVIIILMRS